MVLALPANIAVIDFRRQSMVLQWNSADGTWVACDVPPALTHGVALIRASQPNICVFGRDGRLHLQIGSRTFVLSGNSPQLTWRRGMATFGLRRCFALETGDGGVVFSHAYWSGQGDEFFSWLVARAADPQWRTANARRWSEGVEPTALRSS